MKKIIIALLFSVSLFLYGKSQNHDSVEPKFKIVLNEPKQIIQLGEGHYLIDFGKAFYGTLTLESETSQKDSIIIHLGEKLSQGNRIARNPGGTIRYQAHILPDITEGKAITVRLNRDRRNTTPPAIILPDSFGVIIPFRYSEIENLQIPIHKIEIRQKAYHYEFNDSASAFHSSDTVLNKIWDLCKHTIKATSFAGYYIDGDRERIPYEADAYINQLSHYAVDSVYSIARRTNEYFIHHPTWPTEWILHTAKMFYYDYLYTGNSDLIAKYYQNLVDKTLMELAREDGLISTTSTKLNDELMEKLGFENDKQRIRDIVDWPPNERDGYEMKDVNTVVNSFYYENLRIMALIAGAIGEKEDSTFYHQKSIKLKKVFHDTFFNDSKGLYVDGEGSDHSSLHANLFPLVFNLVPEENMNTVIRFIKSKGMACSVYGAQYLLEGLYKNLESKNAYQLITDTVSDRSWWNMIKAGSTMTLEAWDIKYKSNLDWNHAWGTAPANIITRYIWGITPLSPGFNTVQICPQLTGLNFCELKLPTINGIIYAKFREVANKRMFEIELPHTVSGQFILVDEGVENITVNGTVQENKGPLRLGSGLNFIVIKN